VSLSSQSGFTIVQSMQWRLITLENIAVMYCGILNY